MTDVYGFVVHVERDKSGRTMRAIVSGEAVGPVGINVNNAINGCAQQIRSLSVGQRVAFRAHLMHTSSRRLRYMAFDIATIPGRATITYDYTQ